MLVYLALLICLVGVMDFWPGATHDPSTWKKDSFETVSGFYGPGVIIAWYLGGVSMLYDANTTPDKFHLVHFDWAKYIGLIVTGLWALGDAVYRALHVDFGPSYAAALYMSDKAFELAVLLYCVKMFGVHRHENAEDKVQPGDLEHAM